MPPGGVRERRTPATRHRIRFPLSYIDLVGRSERRVAAPLGRRWHGSTGESDPGRASSWIRCGSNNRQRKKPSHGSTGAAIPGRAVPVDWRGDKPSSCVASLPSPPRFALALASLVAQGGPALAVGHRRVCGLPCVGLVAPCSRGLLSKKASGGDNSLSGSFLGGRLGQIRSDSVRFLGARFGESRSDSVRFCQARSDS